MSAERRSLGPYRIGARLGEGGMGVVYGAEHREHREQVALKMLRPGADLDARVLRREFTATASAIHPNLVRMYELGNEEDTWFFSMERIRGARLNDVAVSLSDQALLRVTQDLVGVVHASHSFGLLHLDIKPPNLMIRDDGGLVLLDFGISRSLHLAGLAGGAGTRGFMAPERDRGVVGPGSDWFAVGVTLSWLLTGDLRGTPAGDSPLSELTRRLRDPDPRRRGGWRDCEELINATWTPILNNADGGEIQMVGRDVELAHLSAAWRRAVGGKVEVVAIRGAPGLGKTLLVRTFAERAQGVAPPRRSLAPVAPETSRRLSLPGLRAPPDWTAVRCHPREPMSLRVIRALFDQLGLPQLESGRSMVAMLAGALRHRSRTAPMLLTIDDAQWADEDSATILGDALTRIVDRPILLLCAWTSRSEEEPAPAFVRQLNNRTQWLPSTVVLAPLSASGANPSTQVDEADPFAAALGALEPSERELLDVVALGGRPLLLEVAILAAGGVDRPLQCVTTLQGRRLLRATGLRPRDRVECWDSRVRGRVESALSDGARVRLHLAIAKACVEVGDAPPGALAMHFRGANELPAAAAAARTGADLAGTVGAWLHAATLWRQAAECAQLTGDQAAAAGDLRRAADSLLRGGHRGDAGRTLLEVASVEAADQAVATRLVAGGHLLAAGEVAAGRRELAPLLLAAGLADPATPFSATWRAAFALARIAAVDQWGHPSRRREDAAWRARLCWAVARGLLATDVFTGMYFSVQGLSWALRSDDEELASRMLAVVGSVILGPVGGLFGRWGAYMLERAERAARISPTPLLSGVVHVGRTQQLLLAGEWARALVEAQAACGRLGADSVDASWERDVAALGSIRAAQELGQGNKACREAAELRHSGQARGDLYAEVTGALYEAEALLPAGEVAATRALLSRFRAVWTFPGFHMQHAYAVRTEAAALLYDGEPAQARALVEQMWPDLIGSGIMQLPLVYFDMWDLRIRAALATGRGDPGRWVRRLLNHPLAYIRAWGRALSARVTQANQGPDLRTAAAELERLGMRGRAALARLAACLVEGTDASDEEDQLVEFGVVDPERWLAVQLPTSPSVQAPR